MSQIPGGMPPNIYDRIHHRLAFGKATSQIAELLTLDVMDVIRNVVQAHMANSSSNPVAEKAVRELWLDLEARSGLKP